MTLRRVLLALLLMVPVGAVVRPAAATPPPGAAPSYCFRSDGGYRCLIGPFDVGAGERVEMMTGVAAPSEAGYMTSGKAMLVDGGGEPIDHHRVHLHHAVWLNPYEQDMTCDSYDGAFPAFERFFATGKELTRVDLPRGYGYFWDPGASQPYTQSAPWWALVVHLDGRHGGSGVYIQLDIGYVPEAEADGIANIETVWLDVRNCSSDPVFDVPGGGGVHKERWVFQMPLGGRFVYLAGHLHDGGLRISVENLTTGRHLYTSKASYGIDEEPWYLTKMSSWSGVPGIKVRKGDELRLTAVYDNTRSWEDVMGIMVGAFVPTS